MRRWSVIVGVVVVAFGIAASARAQDSRLPSADDLPDGWTVVRAEEIAPSDTAAIAGLTEAVYLGPEGGRASVLLARVHEGPAAARTSWELMGQSFDNVRFTFDTGFGSERDLAEQPVVDGCADMRRVEGQDEAIGDIAAGASLCAADPDTLVLAYVSGEWDGLRGHRASDALIGLVLGQAAAATPEAA